MTILRQTFGSTTIAKLSNPNQLKQILDDPWLKFKTIVIKPNFGNSVPGRYMDSESLRALLETLDSHIVVTEGHSVPRSMKLTRPEDWGNAPTDDGARASG
jgi:hypothetical protein